MGKTDKRRPRFISDAEWERRHELTFDEEEEEQEPEPEKVERVASPMRPPGLGRWLGV